MNKREANQTPHPHPKGPPTEDLEAVLEEMARLEADLLHSKKEAPSQAPDFSPPPTIEAEALLGPGVGAQAAAAYYQVIGWLADRPTLHAYIPEPTLQLQGQLAETAFAKFFPGDSLQNYPEYILLISLGVSTWMALSVAPTSAQLAAGGSPFDGRPTSEAQGEDHGKE